MDYEEYYYRALDIIEDLQAEIMELKAEVRAVYQELDRADAELSYTKQNYNYD